MAVFVVELKRTCCNISALINFSYFQQERLDALAKVKEENVSIPFPPLKYVCVCVCVCVGDRTLSPHFYNLKWVK